MPSRARTKTRWAMMGKQDSGSDRPGRHERGAGMPVGLTEEHRALASAMGGLAQRHAPRELTRQGLEGLIAGKPPAYWKPLLDGGLLTLHLPESHGGDDADGVA